MYKTLIQWFKSENLLVQAKELVIEMLGEDLKMFNDSIKLLWTDMGVTIDEIRERDRDINRHVREVRKKVLTHLAFSGASGLDTSLTLINMVVDIERIGDHTKDIGYLATDFPGVFNPGDFRDEVKELERAIADRLVSLVDIFENGEEGSGKALQLTRTHAKINQDYHRMLERLLGEENSTLTTSQSAKLALYLRYLRRVDGHIFNIASSKVNPFHRIGFRKKNKKKQTSA